MAAAAVTLVDGAWLLRYGVSAESEERTAMIRLGRVAPVAGAPGGGQEMTLIAVPAAQGEDRAFETRMVDASGAVRGMGTVCSRFELLPTGAGGMKPGVAPKAEKRYFVWASPKPALGQPGEACAVTPHPDDVQAAMQRPEVAPPGPAWTSRPPSPPGAAAPTEGAAVGEDAAGVDVDGPEEPEGPDDPLVLLATKLSDLATKVTDLSAKVAGPAGQQPGPAGQQPGQAADQADGAGPPKPAGDLGEALWAAAYAGPADAPPNGQPADVYKLLGGLGRGPGASGAVSPTGYPNAQVPVASGAGGLSHYGFRTGSAIRPGHRRVAAEVLDRIGSKADTVRAYVAQEYSHVSAARYGEMEVLAAMLDTAVERAARTGVPRAALLADDALEIAASRLLALDLMERDGNVSGALSLQAVATDNYLSSTASREAASKVAQQEQKLRSALNSLGDKSSGRGKGRGGKGVVCFLCEENHAVQDCPKLAVAKAAVKK